jgi:hypothetical protein
VGGHRPPFRATVEDFRSIAPARRSREPDKTNQTRTLVSDFSIR